MKGKCTTYMRANMTPVGSGSMGQAMRSAADVALKLQKRGATACVLQAK